LRPVGSIAAITLIAGSFLACTSKPKLPPEPLPTLDTSTLAPAVRTVIDEAAAAARKQPELVDPVLRFGMTLQAHAQYDPAIACYARAHALDPQRYEPLYYSAQILGEVKGDHKAAAERLAKAVRIRPSSRAARLALARELRESGDTSAAADLARKLTQEDPADATAFYLLGRAANSEADLQRALQLYPRYGAARFALANLYRQSGKAAQAAEMLRDSERDQLTVPPVEDPETAAVAALAVSPAALLRRARQEDAAGRIAEAAVLQHQVIAMQPDNVEAWINLISLNARLGRDAEVETAYNKASQLAPDRPDVHYNYGVYCLQRNQFPAAKAAFQRTIAIAPRHAEAYMNLGGILANEGRLPEAAAMLRKALEAKPGFEQARFELNRIESYLRQRP
jgi:tetratricopeptide (TPR) repeat protein